MGLLDFARDVGRQLFDTDAEAADNIKEHIEIQTSGVKNVTVEYDDGVATVCGDTLGAIAKQFYGKSSQYMRIFEANKEIISDPNKIYPGQKIRIPLD